MCVPRRSLSFFYCAPNTRETYFSFRTHLLTVGLCFSWVYLSGISRTSETKNDRIASNVFAFSPNPPLRLFLCARFFCALPSAPNRLRLFRPVPLSVQVLLGTSRDPLPHRHRQLDVLRPRHGRRRRPRSMTPPPPRSPQRE